MLARLKPFRGLPNPREVWAWGMYDLANQSFTLLIVTLFFSIYFQNSIATTPAEGKRLWGWAMSLSAAVVVLLGPLLGALADFGGRKKAWLTWLAIGCSVLTVGLAFTGPGDVWLAFGLFVLANIMFMGGENFLAAFLPEIATRDTMSNVSAIGWTMGYLGALLVLPIAAVMLISTGQSPLGFKMVFAFAGAWFILNALPTLLILKERKTREALPPGTTLATIGFVRLGHTARSVPKFRALATFLATFLVYSCGMTIIIAFSGELAFQYLGAGAVFLGFCWLLSLVAAAGAICTGMFQERLGHRRTVAISLGIWVATCLAAAALPPPSTPVPGAAPNPANAPVLIWLVGVGVGWGLGMTGNASRTLVGVMTPRHKTAEFFGMWGFAYKLAAVVGPAMYGEVASRSGTRVAMLLVAGFFVAGLIGLIFVDVASGRRAAEEAEGSSASDPSPSSA